ncbi:MAG TPA: response regulator [Ktedonobacteraceae bacterium]|nr:response regulator [Ktedonobacteraceae bacterium]
MPSLDAHRYDLAKRILVVDDRNELLHLMRRVLEDEQYQVSILQEGRDAFTYVKSLLPDLLILDLKLGNISGQDVLKQLKNDSVTVDIPVIVYTAAVLEADEVSSLIEGNPQRYQSVYLLRKPFELNSLLDKVEELLDKSGR